MKIEKERKMVPTRVGMRSLVGLRGGEFPLSFGNYFSFTRGNGRCVNMWAENLVEWAKQNDTEQVECVVLSYEDCSLAVVVDHRVREEWLIHDHIGNRKMCLTGAGFVPRGLTEAAAEVAVASDRDYCGCEEPETRVHISDSYHGTGEGRKHFRYCYNCKREWEV